jgi:cell division protein FtsB
MTQPTYDELFQENQKLRARISLLEAENAQLHRELEALRRELAEAKDDDLPPFVKPRRRPKSLSRRAVSQAMRA